MEKTIRIFQSFAEAEAAEIAEDQAMTPEKRIQIMLELKERFEPNASQQGLARVYRITQFQRG